MPADWLILHAGALGDLVLTIQLALRFPRVGQTGWLHLVSRSNPGDLSGCRPSVTRQAADGLGLHWLYGEQEDPPPEGLRQAVQRGRVLNALGGVDSTVHRRLDALAPGALFSFDPRPRANLQRHITQQWQSDLESQGLLIPKCIQQRPGRRSLGAAETLRSHGRDVLRSVASDAGCVLIHPGSGGREKCWPLACFLAVGRLLVERGAGVCFLLGLAELDWWSAAELAAIERQFPLLRLPQPDALAAALAAARVVIANDSGPAHLAALLGTTTIAIFGPTAPAIWRPLGQDVRVITGETKYGGKEWGIDPEQVVSLASAGL